MSPTTPKAKAKKPVAKKKAAPAPVVGTDFGELLPRKKVAAGGITGAVTVLVVYVAGLLGLEVPPESASAFTVLLSFVAAYFQPS